MVALRCCLRLLCWCEALVANSDAGMWRSISNSQWETVLLPLTLYRVAVQTRPADAAHCHQTPLSENAQSYTGNQRICVQTGAQYHENSCDFGVFILDIILLLPVLFSRLRVSTHRGAPSAFYAWDLQHCLWFLVFILDLDNGTW